MSDSGEQAEIERLRAEVESYRQRELTQLQEQLAEARADVSHYRAEAERNAEVGRQIHNEAVRERTMLLARIQALEQMPDARVPRAT